ncbi:MAG TPA: response regulator [Anaerolineaceae bacterium]
MKILVVDDESGIVLLCQQLLELSEYEVTTATEPAQAIDYARQKRFDLLLTDIRLPVMDGFDLVNQIKAIQPQIAVVVMTGYNTVETAIKALRSGVDGLVIKPYELGSELLEIVQQAEAHRRRSRHSVELDALQPLFDFGSLNLLETSLPEIERNLLQVMANVLQAANAGIYIRPEGGKAYRPVRVSGTLPALDDPFWENASLCALPGTDSIARWSLSRFDIVEGEDLLQRLGYSCCAAVCVQRPKETFLFLAARQGSEPEFLQADFDLLERIARQGCARMENMRLVTNLTHIARRVEGAEGIFRQSERMQQIENLLPAMLPDFHNPLQALKNSLVLAKRPENQGSRAGEYLSMAQKELYRLEVALQRLLSLAQPSSTQRGPVEIESLMQQVLDLMAAQIKDSGAQVKTTYARPLSPAVTVREDLEQVIFILLENALDALRQAPAGEDASVEKHIWINVRCENERLQINIEDSGPGFSPQARANLFRPFNTSKPQGRGIGLVVARRIVEAQGGRLTSAKPVHGLGANLQVELPC